MVWCINYPNVVIRIFCKRWSFIWRYFFPASILKSFIKNLNLIDSNYHCKNCVDWISAGNVTLDVTECVLKRERKILRKYLKICIIFVYISQIQHYGFKIKLQSSPSKGNTRCSREQINEILQYNYQKTKEKSWQPDNGERSFKGRNNRLEIFNAVSFWYKWLKACWRWRKSITILRC